MSHTNLEKISRIQFHRHYLFQTVANIYNC